MAVIWKREYTPEQLTERIESIRERRPDGKIQYTGRGLELKEYEAILYSMLKFPENIPEIDVRNIISKAIFSAGAMGKVTVKTLLAEVNKLETEYQKLPLQRYVLVTSISISSYKKLPKIFQTALRSCHNQLNICI